MNAGMSPDEFQNYLGLLSRLLRLKATEREAIAEELRSHLEERVATLTAEGIEPARAISMALAEFGDAAALAAEFTAVS
ncbi:MAG: permease prefix domain 1-containing protein, partial [Thermoguttaceae bacterium]